MKEIIFCSSNAGKTAEVQLIAERAGFQLFMPREKFFIEENGSTYLENAKIKALAWYDRLNQPVLADDSGLEVKALNGAPGIYSARYAGAGASDHQNLDLLLQALSGREDRQACYVSALYYFDGAKEVVSEGRFSGEITHTAAGEGGFGYDPIFIPAEDNPRRFTLAQLKQMGVQSRTHRIKSLESLFEQLAG